MVRMTTPHAPSRIPFPAPSAPVVTDAGLETWLVFEHGIDLPAFAAYPLVATEQGRALLSSTTSTSSRSPRTWVPPSCSRRRPGGRIPTGPRRLDRSGHAGPPDRGFGRRGRTGCARSGRAISPSSSVARSDPGATATGIDAAITVDEAAASAALPDRLSRRTGRRRHGHDHRPADEPIGTRPGRAAAVDLPVLTRSRSRPTGDCHQACAR